MTIKDIVDPIGKVLNWFYTTEDGLSIVLAVVVALVIYKFFKWFQIEKEN